jgi:hypothetical protein
MFRRLTAEGSTQDQEFPPVKTASEGSAAYFVTTDLCNCVPQWHTSRNPSIRNEMCGMRTHFRAHSGSLCPIPEQITQT